MKRRKFIENSALLSSTVIAGTSGLWAASNVTGANDRINMAVIGTGDRGQGMIPFLSQIEGLHLAACCDVLPFRLDEGMAKAGTKTKGYTKYESLLNNKNIDAVLIATPFNTHSQIAIDALDAGKHVYCEKTMAKGLDGINALVAKVSEGSQIFQTGHQYHSSRLYAHVVELIKKGEIGKITSFECQWNRNGDWRRPVPDPSLERAVNWRMYREYSGGLTAELSSHQIDFVHWVLGENPAKIMGAGGVNYWKDGRETYDNTHLIFEYPSGVKATFRCLTSNSLGDYQIKVHGDKGTILLDYGKAWIYYEGGDQKEMGDVDGVSGATANPQMQGYGKPIEVSHMDPSKQALIDFRDSIQNNSMPISNVKTGADTAKAVQLSLDAMYKNEIVSW
ncbi:Gfo/Idh/MocA family protein [Lutimonas sp.]|uniref:Gfo/Idh/MocA family protein n=1 Tax=Lutimonas sp. TaxID=1872403 RepID=UPI003D9B2455